MKEKYTDKEILGAFLLVNDYRILSNEELDDVNISITNLLKENEELKKELKKYKMLGFNHLLVENEKLKTQQKEFVKWLENKVKVAKINNQGCTYSVREEILSKYKEIIGANNE